jgi:hypothetical protein
MRNTLGRRRSTGEGAALTGRQRAFGRTLVTFGVLGVLGAVVLLLRGPESWPYLTRVGVIAVSGSVIVLIGCAVLLAINRNPWFRIPGAAALIFLLYILGDQAYSAWMFLTLNPGVRMVLFGVDSLGGPAFWLVVLALGPLTFVAGSRFLWLGLDRSGGREVATSQPGGAS